jgi:hypothetical protein
MAVTAACGKGRRINQLWQSLNRKPGSAGHEEGRMKLARLCLQQDCEGEG